MRTDKLEENILALLNRGETRGGLNECRERDRAYRWISDFRRGRYRSENQRRPSRSVPDGSSCERD